MYIPDTIEIMKAGAAIWADKNIKGSKFKCSCGKWCELKDAETLSPNPYAIPVCRNCCEEYYNRKEKNES
jgi:hypothetical protein